MKKKKFIENLDSEIPELIKSFYPLNFLRKIYLTITVSASKNLSNNAASGAFYFLLSIIPLALFFVYVLDSWLSDYGQVSNMFFLLLSYINPEFNREFFDKIGLLKGGNIVYGFLGVIGLFWSIRLVFNSIRSTFNIIFQRNNKRGIIRNSLIDLIFIPIIIVICVAFLLLSQLLKQVDKLISFFNIENVLKISYMNIFSDITVLALSVLIAFIIYKFIPEIKIKWTYALSGAIYFVISIFILQIVLSKLIVLANYHLVYGLISTVIIALMWAFFLFFLLYFFASYIVVQQKSLELEFIKWFSLIEGKGNFIDKFIFSKGLKSFKEFYITLNKGDVLFKEGECGQYIYFLLDGDIDIYKNENLVGDVDKNSFFGEAGVAGDCIYNSTAKVKSNGSCLKLSAEFYHRITSISPEISKAILDTAVMRKY